MGKKEINIGIMGCGWISEHAHIKALLENGEANVKAVFDVDSEKAVRISNQFSIPYVFSKLEEFLNCGLDGVIVATPNYTHAEYTKEALKQGIGVLCEKPVALNVSEIKEIIELIDREHAVYVPGFVNRWRKDMQEITHALQKKAVGDICKIDAGWIRRNGVPRPGTWFTNRKFSGGGVLADLGSHVLDLCLLFLGDAKPIDYRMVTSVCNYNKIQQTKAAEWFQSDDTNKFHMDVEDTAIVQVNFEQGIMLNAKLSWLAQTNADGTYFKITGTKGIIEAKTLFGFSNERLWKEDMLTVTIDGEKKEIKFDKEENSTWKAFLEMHHYFINALREGKTEFTNSYDALKAVSLIENLYNNETENAEKAKELLKGHYAR